MKKKIFKSLSEKDTKKLAAGIADLLRDYNVVCLYGEMGAGKTTFVKALASFLGIKSRIISPTYIIIRKHRTKKGKDFYHIDAYRINDKKNDVGEIKEILNEENAIIVIEWADRIKKYLPKKRIDIEFLYKEKKDEREIRIIEIF